MSYDSVILADGPGMYLKLDDASGPAVDSSGHGHNVAVRGTPTFRAASLFPSGANSMTTTAGNAPAVDLGVGNQFADINGNKMLTVEAWIGGVSATGVVAMIVASDINSGGDRYFQIRLGTTGKFEFVSFNVDNNGFLFNGATRVLTDGSAYHVVATCDATAQAFGSGSTTVITYVNGVKDGPTQTQAMGDLFATTNRGLSVGEYFHDGSDANGLAGSVQAAAIYTKVLSPAQVFAHYQAGLGIFPASTVDVLTPPPVRGLR